MNLGDVVTLKPLRWKEDETHRGARRADTVFGTIYVKRAMDLDSVADPERNIEYTAPWSWDCCVSEYYDENRGYDFPSRLAAIAAAEAWYISRVAPALRALAGVA